MRRLRVVSWNVGRVYSPSSNNRLDDADIPRVTRVLDELDADVVLLQELVSPEQLEQILSRLPEYEGRLAERCRYDRHVAALAKTRLRPHFEQHLLEDTGRGLCAVTFDVGAGARGAAHAIHFDVFNRERRRSQADEVLALTLARDEPLVVVAGDFNLDPELAAGTGNLTDVETFARMRAHFADDGRAAGPTLLGLFRVDHLLARGPKLARVYARVSPSRRLPLGDHDPLIGELELVK